MKKVIIQYNEFDCEQRPTTQEDNFGLICDKWDLFRNKLLVGNLVQYTCGSFAVFHNLINSSIPVRYDISENEVSFN